MPASLPGDDKKVPAANPSAGQFVIFDPLSGPKGSPLDSRKLNGYVNGNPTYLPDATQKNSTGAMSTGIGFGCNHLINVTPGTPIASPTLWAIFRAGFNDDAQPGQKQAFTAAPPPGNTSSNTVDSKQMYIGGGRSNIVPGSGAGGNGVPAGRNVSAAVPYTAGVSICGAGNGGSRDAGVGPAIFTGFPFKMVTAVAQVLNGVSIEGTWFNRSGLTLQATQSAFGSSNAALAAPA